MTAAMLFAIVGCNDAAVSAPPDASPDLAPVTRAVETPTPAPVVEAPPPAPPAPPDPAVVEQERLAREREAFEAAYPLHGVAYHFLAQIFSAPSKTNGRVIGYMRRGAQFRAKRVERGQGCSQGWYQVPGDGYVCRGIGYQIGETPQTFEGSPVAPSLDDALPYVYVKTGRDDVPQYWRLPTDAEQTEAARLMNVLRDQETHQTARAPSTVATSEARADSVDAPPPPGQAPDTGRLSQMTSTTLPDFLRMRMLRAFYVTLDRLETAGGTEFVRTVRGGYVERSTLIEPTLPTMRGVVLGGSWQLPVAFVFRTGVHRLHVDANSNQLVDDGAIERHTPMVVEDEAFVRRNKTYVISDEGVAVREPSLRVIHPVERPVGIGSGDHWIHVDLSQQSLVAYEGDAPVFVTLVSSGKEDFETPTGLFQIQSKHVSTTMDDAENPDGAYSIEDVPWTMYFSGNYALHGAFWHNNFGNVRSHGCVNLSPIDARWLFQWSTPTLPASWHGVFSDRQHAGTWVYITE